MSLGALEDRVGFLMQIALVEHVEAVRLAMPEMPLRASEFALLEAIAANPAARQGELGDLLRIKWPHLTKMVARLEQRGLVTRRTLEGDRRAVGLDLTPEGAALLAAMRAEFFPAGEAALSMLSPAEMAQLVGLLRKIIGRAPLTDTQQGA